MDQTSQPQDSMREAWKLLKWSHVCNLVSEIDRAFEVACYKAEYGRDWHEFINSEAELPELRRMAQNWWNEIPEAERLGLLHFRTLELAELQEQLKRCMRSTLRIGGSI